MTLLEASILGVLIILVSLWLIGKLPEGKQTCQKCHARLPGSQLRQGLCPVCKEFR